MVQFNLLPDVKIEYIKTKYRKRLIMIIAGLISAVCLLVFILLFLFVRVNQTKYMRDLDKDIKKNVSTIQGTQDLDKILTIQNQLNSLPDLQDKKVYASRIVPYLSQVVPQNTKLTEVNTDFEASTITLSGKAGSFVDVNKFVDTLKFTDYKLNNESAASGKAFKNVVLKSFNLASVQNGVTGNAFEITLEYDPALFKKVDGASQASQPVILTVPKITSTRSETEKPDASGLFTQPQPSQGAGR